jgi:beta-carotene hydroxylase
MEQIIEGTQTLILKNGSRIPKKPSLPSKFTKFNPLMLARHILLMFLIWCIPAYIAHDLIVYFGFWASLPGVLLCTWLASYGLSYGQWIGHDGCHGASLPNKEKGMMLGTFFASATPFYSNIGFSIYHLEHHAHVNTNKDADTHYYSKYNNLISRLFIVRIKKNRDYLKGVYTIFKQKGSFGPFDAQQTRRQIIFNIISSVFWLCIYGVIFYFDTIYFLTLVVLPTLSLAIFSGCLTYQQHANTGDTVADDYWRNSRSLTSWFWTVVYGGGNYHLEHHLYPRVPVWNLHKVHKYLKKQGFYNQSGMHFDSGAISGYRYFKPSFIYPSEHIKTDSADIYQDHPSKAY